MGARDWQPSKIKKAHVLEAADTWDRRAATGNDDHPFFTHNFRYSSHFDVLIEGKAHPPKAITSCACGLATGQHVPTSEFARARDGLWHRRLMALGFQVVKKKRDSLSVSNASSSKKSAEENIKKILSDTINSTQLQALIDAMINQETSAEMCSINGINAARRPDARHLTQLH